MSEHQKIKARRLERKKQQKTLVLIVVGIALVLSALLMMPFISQAILPVGDFVQPELDPRPGAKANAIGDPGAAVVIAEYSDFGCGYCGLFAQTKAKEIEEKYVSTGKVYFVFHSVGAMLGHPNSIVTAEAAYCAGDQNMFWDYHDLLYANQATLFANMNKNLDKTLDAYAEALGLDLNEFETCLRQNKYAQVVQQDMQDALQAGVGETPSFVINGKLFLGDWTSGALEDAIEAELSEGGQ